MNDPLEPVAAVARALETSEFLRVLSSVRADGGRSLALGDAVPRPLSREEVARLESQGNSADDWSRLRVVEGFAAAAVRLCRFHGDVVLGRFRRPVRLGPRLEVPSGLYRSTLADAVVGDDALVQDVGLLSRCVIGPGALVQGVGALVCDGPTTFGNGASLPLAIETGGRDVPVYAEIDVSVAAAVARWRRDRLGPYAALVQEYARRAASELGVVGPGAVVRDTPEVRNAYIAPGARVAGATVLSDSTLLSSAEEPVQVLAGACVRASVLQWGSRVDSLAIVEGSVLTEHSHAERHGKVLGSLLGPNTGVAEGEVNSSLLGPFVGFHHQALLIAALWPEGKGNVASGAQVGSNHTSRAPDQEFWPGEGAYLGLGVSIKYPSDFTRAPYTIVATGVSTLPQKLAFPFSLINQPWRSAPGISPAYNEIVPAWVLTDNLYFLKRNETKFKERDRARRSRFEFAIFRPDTVNLMRDACGRLESVNPVKEFYTERDIDGLGKNFLHEEHRRPAVAAYRFFIRLYALLGLKERLPQGEASGSPGKLLVEPSATDAAWEHQRRILHDELGLTDVRTALEQLPAMLKKVADDVERAKAKDDRRGPRILDDYALAHVPAAEDAVVRRSREEAQRLVHEVQQLLADWK